MIASVSSRLSTLWRSAPEAVLPPTSLGVSGGLWSLPVRQRLEIPPLDQMRLIVNLAPLEDHRFWSEGHQRRSGSTAPGAIRIAPVEETARAEVRGTAFRFAQIYIPRNAIAAFGGETPGPGGLSAFRDLNFDVVDPLVAALTLNLLSEDSEPAELLYHDQLALTLLVHLSHRYSTKRPPAAAPGRLDGRRLRRVLDYLESAQTTPSIRELGALVGLSPYHFARGFRLALGMPPHAWLRTLRMERAKRALRQTTLSVTEIAFDCGYASPSTFTAAFTRTIGCSPTAWRRMA